MIVKNIKWRILEYFFLHPTKKLRVRQIEREVRVPLPSAIRYVKELIEEDFLKREEIGGVVLYSAARKSEQYRLHKQQFNIRKIYGSGLIKYLKEELSNPTIVLFGSYSKGEDTEESDIDLYIETASKQKVELSSFEKALERRVQIFVFKKIHTIENKELANNIINGVTLNGFIEVL